MDHPRMGTVHDGRQRTTTSSLYLEGAGFIADTERHDPPTIFDIRRVRLLQK